MDHIFTLDCCQPKAVI